MPLMSNLVLADGQATPVNHTFVPAGRIQNGGIWEERVGVSPAGWATIRRTTERANGKLTVHRDRTAVTVPEVVTDANGNEQVIRYSSGEVKLNFHPNATTEERNTIRAYLANVLLASNLGNAIRDLDPSW